MTSLSVELGRRVTVEDVRPAVREAVLAAVAGDLPVSDHPLPRPYTTTVGGVTVEMLAGR